MFAEATINAIRTSTATATARRDAKKALKRPESSISFGLFEVDQNRVGGEKCDDDRDKVKYVAQVYDAAGDGAEMAEEAHLPDGVDQPFGCPTLQQAENDRRARGGEHKSECRGHDKGDDLVLGHRRDAGADGQQCARHQPAAYVARQDHAVVGLAEKIDRDPEWESQGECDPGKTPGSEEFSDHGLGHAYRQCQEQLDRPALAFLGPQPHRQRRDQDEVEPGMKGEEGLQVGLPALEEIAEKKGQHSRHDEKDDYKHVGERSGEIAGELAAKNGQDVVHCRQIRGRMGGRSCGPQLSLRRPVALQPTDEIRGESRDPLLRHLGLSSIGNTVRSVSGSRCGEMDLRFRGGDGNLLRNTRSFRVGPQAAAATRAGSGWTVVISRKTSSSRPRSTLRPVTSQPWARARSAMLATIGRPPPGKIIRASPSLSLTVSTVATPGSRASSARTCGPAPDAMPRRTALWWRERSASCAGVPSARIRPCAMMIARLPTASTSSSRWVEMM